MGTWDNNALHSINGNSQQPEKRYSTTEAIDILQLSERSIYQRRKSHILPYSQMGKRGQVYFTWSDFEKYWENIKK